jgi:hypothetical protein
MKDKDDRRSMFSHIDLKNGDRVLNLTYLVKNLEDFTTYLLYLVNSDKDHLMMWLKFTPQNRIVFETILPLYQDTFNRYDRQRFLTDGCILVDKDRLYASYPVGKTKEFMWQHGKELIIEGVENYYNEEVNGENNQDKTQDKIKSK